MTWNIEAFIKEDILCLVRRHSEKTSVNSKRTEIFDNSYEKFSTRVKELTLTEIKT